jgi:hypothetical protein
MLLLLFGSIFVVIPLPFNAGNDDIDVDDLDNMVGLLILASTNGTPAVCASY